MCVCVCAARNDAGAQVLFLLAQILMDLFIASPAFSAILLSLLSFLCKTRLSFELISSPQGKSSLSCPGEEGADFSLSEVQAGKVLLPCFPQLVAQNPTECLKIRLHPHLCFVSLWCSLRWVVYAASIVQAEKGTERLPDLPKVAGAVSEPVQLNCHWPSWSLGLVDWDCLLLLSLFKCQPLDHLG